MVDSIDHLWLVRLRTILTKRRNAVVFFGHCWRVRGSFVDGVLDGSSDPRQSKECDHGDVSQR